MSVIWSQLLGMKFSRRAEFKSIHSFLNPVLRNGNTAWSKVWSTAGWRPTRKGGVEWQAPRPGWQCDSRDDRFDNNVLYLLPDGITVDSLLAQVAP